MRLNAHNSPLPLLSLRGGETMANVHQMPPIGLRGEETVAHVHQMPPSWVKRGFGELL